MMAGMTQGPPAVRPATEADLGAINDIYNHYIGTSHSTFDLEEHDLAWRRAWLAERSSEVHRVFVAERGGRVVGFASSGAHRPRGAYRTSVETSLYVAPDATGAGVGTALYEALFDALDRTDLHRALAGITVPNDASIALHLAFGFRPVGTFTEQGHKFGRFWDVEWYERQMQGLGADRGAVAGAEALHGPSGA
jgi:phosphinothricin acetyltransferase